MHRYVGLLLSAALIMASDTYQTTTYHEDLARVDRVKLELLNPVAVMTAKDDSAQAIAHAFLADRLEHYGINSLDHFQVTQVKESLMGRHVHFGQHLNGYPIQRAEMIVSINREGHVYRVYNNTYDVVQANKVTPPEVLLDWDDAYDVAWYDLRVHGELMAYPQAELVYQPEADGFRLVYLVRYAVEAPFGYWEHTVDAVFGEVLDVQETSIDRIPQDADDFRAYEGPISNRQNALNRYRARMQQQESKVSAVAATGSAQVFDPDPVTALQNDNLEDNSSASSFNAAYVTRSLQDISLSGGTYRLQGPWVTIANFESPNTSPSTSSSGNWTQTRGNNAFNDVMTYFHVDQSQRYMQSLGFSGSTGIQYTSINVDSDGVNGDDNSHFIPSTNRMAFGHGCVDDNEDAFVILHEYGHAIHHSINNNWSGGDTGAMGEGFGDYWAGSYRYSTANGNFHPAWAFPWDGHNNCWGGRNMDRTDYQYNHSATYGAHSTVGGVYGDELWSTPLFQAMVTLRGQGVPRSEIDQIVLQAHFGLGSGLKMRDMANAIVATAQSLYPSGNHAAVFQQKFEDQSILTGSPPPPPPTGELQNGVPVSGVAGAQGSSTRYTLAVPSGASNLSFTLSGGSGDADLYVSFNSQPTTSSFGYRSWNSSNNESISIPSPSTGTYHVLVYGYATYSGATLTGSYQTQSNQAPTASFNRSINDLTVSFSDSSSDPDGSIASRSWNFGDGSSSTQTNPSHTYSTGGTFTVTLTVTDNGGLSDSTSQNVTVTAPNAAPTASFTQSINGLSVSFTSTSSDSDGTIASHAWNFGDGSTSSSTNPSHSYAAGGTYTVSLTVTDNGGLSNTTSKSITVTAPTGNSLQNGVPVSNLSGGQGSSTFYTLEVPANATNLSFSLSGGSGDADLYVRFGSQPTTSTFDYRSWNSSNNESISVGSANAGTYHVLIYGYAAYSGATLTASYTEGSGGGPVTETVSGSVNGRKSIYYNIDVSGGTIDLSCVWDQSNRDIDLYIYNPSGTRVASATSTSEPETLSYNTNGVSGTFRVRVYNYSRSSATYQLTMTYQP